MASYWDDELFFRDVARFIESLISIANRPATKTRIVEIAKAVTRLTYYGEFTTRRAELTMLLLEEALNDVELTNDFILNFLKKHNARKDKRQSGS